jgi:hypothetical protein
MLGICILCVMFEILPQSGKGLVCGKSSMASSSALPYATQVVYAQLGFQDGLVNVNAAEMEAWMSTAETCSMVQVVSYLGSGRLPLRRVQELAPGQGWL